MRSFDGDTIVLSVTGADDELLFEVRNRVPIPPDVQMRVFQRHFSTKGGAGRGVGTYSMKLFGEEFLGGMVSFTSDPENGTTFMFRPVRSGKDETPCSTARSN